LLENIRSEVAKLSPDEVMAQLEKLKAQKAKQKEYQKSRPLTEEGKQKRAQYNKDRIKRPEVKQKMKEYRERPEVKEKMKTYRQERYERQKALLARAKELGLTA
jgi:hypothetical protein